MIGNNSNNISLIGNNSNNNNISFEHLGFKIPPKECVCRNLKHCPIFQMMQRAVKVRLKQQMVTRMEKTTHPTCMLCGFFRGAIRDKRVKQIRMRLAAMPW